MSEHVDEMQGGEFDVAVVGMAGRFPGADTLEEFWDNLREGRETITHFSREEMEAAGVPAALLDNPSYVPSIGKLRDVETFDAGFFGYSPREAEILEPGHRLFLEVAWEALEDAGVDPSRVDGTVGVYAGAGNSGYADRHVRANPEVLAATGDFVVNLSSGKDFIATRASYKLDLRGPSLTVQTGCSTALVATHLAAQSLLRGECDLALAGGSSVIVPQEMGYLYSPGGISSPDGHCRAFDAKSGGTLSGSGAGVVVLKRLEDALRDGDRIRAVIKGSAINNDGAAKVAYTAPGVEGQSAVIGEALAAADVDPSTIQYVEAHGSGTELGDVIEITALTRAYRAHTDRVGFCAVGAVKTNIGHLDTAAGAAGLIKTILAMENATIPATVHFEAPNPRIDFAGSPFFVPSTSRPWETPDGQPRRAGVSSFGIGGTNAHVILEEAPAPAESGPSRPWQLLTLSARTPQAVDAATERLAAHLEAHADLPLADVAFTLHEGRRAFPARRIVVAREGENASDLLRGTLPERVASGIVEAGSRSLVFMFSGLGDHYPNMARGLYEAEPVFRAEVDRCAEILRPHLGLDIREVIFPGDAPSDEAPRAGGFDFKRMAAAQEATPESERLNRTELAQPAVFVIDWALAKLWMSFGLVPEAVIGHSLGEYAAAAVAGVLSVEDALALVAARAKLIQALPGGAMLAVSLGEADLKPHLSSDVSVATVNAPALCVAAGPEGAIAALEKKLSDSGIVARRLVTTHAFHSRMMEPAAEELAGLASGFRLRPPSIPMISNVTGTWITDAEATDPRYWARHLLGTVRFAEGVEELLKEPRVFLEVGPGQTLSTFVRQRPSGDGSERAAIVPSIRYAYDRKPDQAFLLEALGRLWIAGMTPDWKAFRGDEARAKVPLPTYPWERQRYWVEPTRGRGDLGDYAAPYGKLHDPAEWTYIPTWERTPAAEPRHPSRILLFVDQTPLGDSLATRLYDAASEVVVVRPGDAYTARDRLRTARPDSRDDFRTLAASLAETPADLVVYAWSSDATALLLAADAFGHGEQPLPFVVVTRAAVEVTGDEAIDLRSAPLVGAAAVLPQEYPSLRVRVVDAVGADNGQLAIRLAAEMVAAEAAPLVAWRGRHRWARGFRAERPRHPSARVEAGGAYLVAGGLDARGGVLAQALARVPGVRLILVGPHASDLAAALSEAGISADPIDADAADRAALAEGIRRAETGFGGLRGVLYSPATDALTNLAAVAEVDPHGWTAQLEALQASLEALEGALGERNPQFVLLESSLAGVLGSPGRVRLAMANALVDAFAHRHNQAHLGPWTAVDWDRWRAAGATAVEGDDLWIEADEVGAALDRALALAGEPQVLLSTAELGERARRALAPPAPKAGGAGTYARPELDHSYAEPTNEVEAILAQMWQELLGISPIGIDDDFFVLGGHSLFATQIISRVRDTFDVDLPLAAIFEAPTIARFAVLIEEAIIAEMEDLTDEEALQLAQ